MDPLIEEALAATYLRDFLTIVYSHPSVTDFLTWGFWDGAHWFDNAPFFRDDWTPKPALDTFLHLFFEEWWTDLSDLTDADGRSAIRGFRGRYRITATHAGRQLDTLIWLTEDADLALSFATTATETGPPAAAARVFPNPADQQLHLHWPQHPPGATAALQDLNGRTLIGPRRLQGARLTLSVASLPAGVYVLRLEGGGLPAVVRKVVIERR